MASFLDVCRFTAASSGTGDFVVSAAVTGYQTPASAGAVNAAVYRYRAESSDLSQWEVGYGAYTTGSTTLARTTVLFNSSGTTSKINFSAAPQVAVVLLAEDLATFGDASTNTSSSVDSEIALFSSTGGKTLKRASTTGILKGASGVLSAATAGTDYLAPPSGTAILKANSGGALANATAGTDYLDKATTSTLTTGYTITSSGIGSVTGSNQTVTPNIATRGIQDCTLNGSSLTGTLTWAAPSNGPGVAFVEVVNGGSGAVGATLSTSGYTKVTGDTWATTNGNKYLFWSIASKNYTQLHIQALQ